MSTLHEKKIYTNSIMDSYAVIYFGPMIIGAIIVLACSMMIADGNCVFGGEQIYYQSGNPSHFKCNDIPTPIAVFPGLWFFFGAFPAIYLLHWRHSILG